MTDNIENLVLEQLRGFWNQIDALLASELSDEEFFIEDKSLAALSKILLATKP